MVTIGQSLSVTEFNLGGNVFGWTMDEKASFAVLDHYVDRGGNFIDTADAYMMWVDGLSGAESETIIGRWLASRGNRDHVVITTKVGMWDLQPGLSSRNITEALEGSLRRLNTDYVDLYFAHQDDANTPLEETMGALDKLVRAGKVREIGASNYQPSRLAAALDVAEREGLARFKALQVPYNLMVRQPYEDHMRSLAVREDLAVLPYYSLAQGFLTGKYRNRDAGHESMRASSALKYLDERGLAVLDVMDPIASSRGVAHSAIALAWLMSKPEIAAPIASARTVEQLDDLFQATRLELSASELADLDRASAPVETA